MKKGAVRFIALLAIFIVSLAGFSFYFNRDKEKNTRDFETSTLPTAYIKLGDSSVNRMFGYKKKMDGTTMRESLTPLSADKNMTLQVNPYGRKIKNISYEITSADGSKLVGNARINGLKDKDNLKEASFQIDPPLLMNQEYLLTFSLSLEGESDPVYYYTRIVQRAGVNTDIYLKFVQDFYERCMKKDAAGELTTYLEPDETVSNNSFHNVTIHSNFDQLTWGTLAPKIVNKAVPVIKEANENTLSVTQQYTISAKDTDNNTEYYSVSEFYRMRYTQSRVVLLDFERSATQIFDANLPVITSTGISLGVVGKDVQYVSNKSADIVAFVVDGDLWSYNRSANKCTKIFGFRTKAGDTDERAVNMEHDVKIVRVSETGDISYVVYGYMNLDVHEGKVGSAVYHYNAERNVTQEELFIPSSNSYEFLKQNLSILSYVSQKDQLYLYVEGNLYQVDLTNGSYKIVKDKIASDCFVISKSQASVAWMDDMDENQSTHITALSLETGKTLSISAPDGQKIKALGFINEDLVYGVANDQDILSDAAGNVTFAMNHLYIRNFDDEIIKEYQQDGVYVTQVNIQEGLMELVRATREGNSFVSAANDHIMNNLMDRDKTVSIKMSVSERKGTQVSLVFTKVGKTRNLLVLQTKFIDEENLPTLTIDVPKQETDEYYVYGRGRLLDVTSKVGSAIKEADQNVGVVLNRKQQYVWERGNQPDNRKLDVGGIPQELLSAPLDEATIQNTLGDSYKVMNLSGCSLSSALYQISLGYPVMVRTGDGSSALIVGYDQYNIWLYDTSENKVYAKGMNDSTAEFGAAGNIFISYRDKK
ncbi:hypothetical protein INP51_00595 [Blautia liquoris]|uniref:Peptidase C39-like domain-containing protein n=1 Tax=Blautia liquoris TaxID=2779518 RepID=A0A7M2RHB9_9FIRM|nr:hypothetical protein [Blautia liquoris]QOV19518.1 hypothetical protein INP51_00595 [Blautia liquoris]